MEKPVIILGANSIGKAAHEIFRSNEVIVYGFLDEDKKLHGKTIDETLVLGSTNDEQFLKIIGKDCEAFIANDNAKERRFLVEKLVEDYKTMPVNAIHGTAFVAGNVEMKHGNMINSGVQIGAFTALGGHNLIHSGAIIETDVVIGDYVQVGAGAIINSEVVIEDDVFIGSGAIIISGVTLEKGARIGAGSMVMAGVKKNETVFGNPAKPV